MRTFFAIATLLSIGAVEVAAVERSVEQGRERLNSKIPAPILAKYRDIRDAKDWLNPQITIRAEGIEVVTRAIPGGRKTVLPGELRDLLISLPVMVWPYGRVVLGSDIGLRQVDRSDDEPIRRNHDAAERILKALDVHVDWWPSA